MSLADDLRRAAVGHAAIAITRAGAGASPDRLALAAVEMAEPYLANAQRVDDALAARRPKDLSDTIQFARIAATFAVRDRTVAHRARSSATRQGASTWRAPNVAPPAGFPRPNRIFTLSPGWLAWRHGPSGLCGRCPQGTDRW
jgi:hypothetical protein